jgi:ABC-type Fe3+/spermidine/putrescine transport system ATPase subunit
LGGLASRKVHELSGGERQRVALARSLAPAPRLLMLDEPLGSLDRALRESLQNQVRRILKEVGVTSIYVTHDRDEAFTMADRLVFMNHGRIIQIGTPEEAVANPADGFVARTLGFKNVLPGMVVADSETLQVECSVGVIPAPKPPGLETANGSEITLLVDESGISMSGATADVTADGNSLQGVVIERVFRGDRYELRVRVGNGELYCHAPADAAPSPVQSGQSVTLSIDPRSVRVLSSGG